MSWKQDKSGNLIWEENATGEFDDEPWSDGLPGLPDMKGGTMPTSSTAMTLIEGTKAKASSSSSWKPSCYETHPPYPVTDTLVIYGGSCGYPKVKDADIYIGFDGSMKLHGKSFPWHKNEGGPIEVYFKIWDGDSPDDKEEFRNMVVWTAEQLLAGKKVHAGCIGGHGRTGMFLAALRKHMTGDENATQHVRDHYCKKAVERQKQIDFLFKDWGIAKVAPSKTDTGWGKGSSKGSGSQKSFGFSGGSSGHDHRPKPKSTGNPLNPAASIWGE